MKLRYPYILVVGKFLSNSTTGNFSTKALWSYEKITEMGRAKSTREEKEKMHAEFR
jgi:hypothetical protein